MKIIVCENYEEMSKVASQHLYAHMFKDRRVNLAITAGSTPKKMYELMVSEVKDKDYFENVHYYNFDEIPYAKTDREGITISDLRTLYFNPANIKETNIHKLDMNNWQQQDDRIQQDGGLDAILLGVGTDGHFCGNLPGTTTFKDWTSKVECDPKALESIFEDSEECPSHYVTMGPRSVMNARQLIVFANGKHKAEIIKRVLEGSVDENVPSTILTMHPNVTFILDKDAASLLGK